VLRRINDGFVELLSGFSGDGIEVPNTNDSVEVKLDTIGILQIRWINFQYVPSNSKTPAFEHHIVAFILQTDEVPLYRVEVYGLPPVQIEAHLPIEVGRA